jgi:3-oxoacyl-[acyl-carrier protein] reductase
MNNGHISDRFRDQVSLVVGGAQGIGKAISVRLAREGARVVIGDLDQVAMMHTSEELANEGWQVRSVLCDVAWDLVLETNLRGAFLTARAVVPHMIRRRRGKLVFMSSTNAWDAEAELASYSASKAGIYLLAKTLARELGHYGINSKLWDPD